MTAGSPAARPSAGPAAAWARLGDAPAMLLPALTAAGVAIGGVVAAAGGDGAAVWRATAIVVLVPLAWSVVRTLSRRALGVDVIALIAIVGALALGEELTAAVIALMLSGGNALERYAARRSRRELTALLARAPRSARLRTDRGLVEVAAERVAPGDLLLVRAGEVLPVDGIVESPAGELDESALTGEPLPRAVVRGDAVRSGTTNAGTALDLRATRPAAESAYAGIVRLVQEAGARKAPFVRMADRYAVLFLAVTLALAAIAWAASGDPVRALAVLVVATPCPLILAAPVALVSGVSRAARRGIIVKGAPVIEALGEARAVLLDKTGTLTIGTPSVASVTATGGRSEDEVLGPAAAVEQLSPHVLAAAIVREARRRGLELPLPERVVEDPGRGVEGTVDGVRVAAGGAEWLRARGCDLAAWPSADGPADGHATVLVALDGRLAGALAMADAVRPDAPALVERLRRAGVDEIAIVTGDDPATAAEVARRVGVDGVHAGQTPESKLALVEAERRRAGGTVVMVGDGVNDAPALAAADVGIAMGAAGATASSEAADAVIIDDRVERVAEAVELGRRSLGIARQSVIAGMALSGAAMIAAAAGFLPPLAGALLQEVIDVAVIANALRALRGP